LNLTTSFLNRKPFTLNLKSQTLLDIQNPKVDGVKLANDGSAIFLGQRLAMVAILQARGPASLHPPLSSSTHLHDLLPPHSHVPSHHPMFSHPHRIHSHIYHPRGNFLKLQT